MGIGDAQERSAKNVIAVPLEQIRWNPAQPRGTFSQSEIEDLAADIVLNGVSQPLSVRRVKDGYVLLSGERQLLALRYAMFPTADCVLVEKTVQTPPPHFHPVVKDVRLFYNTINRAIAVMQASGIPASSERIRTPEGVTYVVKIPDPIPVSWDSPLK